MTYETRRAYADRTASLRDLSAADRVILAFFGVLLVSGLAFLLAAVVIVVSLAVGVARWAL